jgi:glycosyltransferase involved in cell wall biosynthesis
MNVLVVSTFPPRHCGIGAYARDQVAAMRANGDHVTVLSPPDGDGDVRVPFFGGRPFFRAVRTGGRFDRIVVHFQPILYYRPRAPVSKVLTSLGLLSLVLLRRGRAEIVVHEADTPKQWRPDYVLLRWAFGRAGRMWFHTEAERKALERDYRVRVRGEIVPHRVHPFRAASREEARGELGLPVGETVFVCAGFLQPSKGFDRAVKAFPAAEGGSLYIVGSVRDPTPENESYARALAERAAAAPRVTFLERYLSDEEFDLWLAAADWLVLPYRRSWSSGVLARAQALGTPAIVAGVGGLPEQAGKQDVVVHNDEELAGAFRAAVAA